MSKIVTSEKSIAGFVSVGYRVYVKARKGCAKRAAAPEQLALFKQRGGKRRGAGRPPKSHRAGAPHTQRPFLAERYPVHVTLRVVPEIGSLRKRAMYAAIRQATLTAASHGMIRIVQISIQRRHLHLLVEAKNKKMLAVGIQSFEISAARHLNVAVGKIRRQPRRRGSVFVDRYHAEIIKSPTQARNALMYLLANWRKHGEDGVAPMSTWKFDWFSSAPQFAYWTEYGEEAFLWRLPVTYEPLWVWRPQTWMLAEGWKKLSSSISYREAPASR